MSYICERLKAGFRLILLMVMAATLVSMLVVSAAPTAVALEAPRSPGYHAATTQSQDESARLVLSPAHASISPGGQVTYTAELHRALSDPADVTSASTFSISPDGSCKGAICTASEPGVHIVTGTVDAGGHTISATATLLVVPPLTAVRLTPQKAVTGVGQSITYTAYGLDSEGHTVVNLTDNTRFLIRPEGFCAGANCTALKPGPHTVIGIADLGNDSTLSGTASVLAEAGLTLKPDPATISPGESVTYRAYLNPDVEVTKQAMFSIIPDGSCNAATCTATTPGDHTVTGTVDLGHGATASGTAVLHVVPGPLASVKLSPAAAKVTAGDSVTYRADGADEFGNLLGEVTTQATFSISPDGSCSGATCTATVMGIHTVTGTVDLGDGVTAEGSAVLRVVPGPLASVKLSPAEARVTVGRGTTYRADGVDEFGNPRGELTAQATFSISPDGSCSAATCTTTTAGDHTITATVDLGDGVTAEGSAVLHVVPGPLASVKLSPAEARVTVGRGTTYRADGVDEFGNPRGELTAQATFSISPDGSCSGATCTAATAGDHTVTATVDRGDGATASGTAVLHMVPGPLASLKLSPDPATTTAGHTTTYRAYLNPKDEITAKTVFSISPDGSCSGDACMATTAGDHTVTGTADLGDGGAASGTAVLRVVPGPLASVKLSPAAAKVTAGDSVTYRADGADEFGNLLGEVTTQATFSISPDGSCSGATCTATVMGIHTVTATVDFGGGVTAKGSAVLRVVPGPLASLKLSPAAARVTAGDSVTYRAGGVDEFGNLLGEVTTQATFSISPDGSCSGATCTAATAGDHTVTGAADRGNGATASGTAALRVKRLVLSHCLPAARQVRHLRVAPRSGPPGTVVRVTAMLNRRFVGCPLALLLAGARFGGDRTVGRGGRFADHAAVPGDTKPGRITVALARSDGRIVATTSFEIGRRPPVVPVPNWKRLLPWLLAGAALLLTGLAVAAGKGTRARRQRRWVRQHVRVEPDSHPGHVTVERDHGAAPTLSVGLEPHGDMGTLEITKEGDP
jgi:plastocyanin